MVCSIYFLEKGVLLIFYNACHWLKSATCDTIGAFHWSVDLRFSVRENTSQYQLVAYMNPSSYVLPLPLPSTPLHSRLPSLTSNVASHCDLVVSGIANYELTLCYYLIQMYLFSCHIIKNTYERDNAFQDPPLGPLCFSSVWGPICMFEIIFAYIECQLFEIYTHNVWQYALKYI